MSWRNLAYGSQQVAESAPVVAPVKEEKPSLPNVVDIPTSVGGKLYRILEYLRHVPLHKPVSSKDIFDATGVDLSMDENVDLRLKNNPKVNLVGSMYAYQAKYNIKNKTQVLRMLERVPDGIPRDDLVDCYVGIDKDLDEFTRTGTLICIRNQEKGTDTYFPRRMSFLSDLSGDIYVQPKNNEAQTSVDLTKEVRRGDAIQIGNQWFRVSTMLKSSASSLAAAATKSVSSVKDPVVTKRIRYMQKFDESCLPMDVAYQPDASGNLLKARKHGCTNDIRALWNDTLRTWPTDRVAFERELVKAGLTTQAMLDASRKQKKPREKTKKIKKRKQRAIKISNQHLIGTELGELLTKGQEEEFTLGAVKFSKQ